ncbi:aminotransferase class V-fold PLP-dependent enzyme [Variovorax sp. EBFNA2]|uniref:aminotransferase class V-fold PLP-dependent enzyme n=1 Tax=Variovorax sp. EBFNA2 TaxID=3342097 RepID=UPI0029BFE12B|nr:aminotransferase class V-fold PLP-dependent enzyme [Variovorax boronicumulans]WPG40867.1 aminotransferase class V-fold PLP-dependent enzyme [Variovorax boronicumulans]
MQSDACTAMYGAAHFTEAELTRLRGETRAWGRYAHFAHGSASLPPDAVYAAWHAWLDTERAAGAHRAAEQHAAALRSVRASVARLVGAQAHQIAFFDSASRAWSTAVSAALSGERPVHVVTTHDEYGANALYLLAAAQRGRLAFSVMSARPAEASFLERLDDQLDRIADAAHLPVVSLPVVPTSWGVATPLAGVAQRVHARGGLLLLDASHAVGQLPVDMRALDCDMLVFPARKWLRGPKGLGVLCLSERALARLDAPDAVDVAGAQWLTGTCVLPHADARRFEGSEFHPGLRLALGAACDSALSAGPARIADQNTRVRESTASTLEARLGWQPLEAGHARATALMTYALPEAVGDAEGFVRRLGEAGVNVSLVGTQHARWALEAAGAGGPLLRLTPHYLTDDEEIERLVLALEALVPTGSG